MKTRHPHAGEPFTDDDHAIAAALEEVSIPTLMCTMVHITGDLSWIRGDIKPAGLFLNEYQGYMDEESKAEVRRRGPARGHRLPRQRLRPARTATGRRPSARDDELHRLC